jgi:flavin reductase (DIM6/NTAB) family NADH-FMN oxidoreductase RutF
MFKAIDPKELTQNPFSLIGEQWMLVTAGTADKCNTMTASWGGVGVMWGKPCATIYLRPQRYTKEFVDAGEYFTLNFLPEEYRKALGYCGSKSGRDVDKIRECGFTMAAGAGGAPYMEEAELVLVCRKRYWNDLDPANMDADAMGHYKDHDYHRMYIGEIVSALVK